MSLCCLSLSIVRVRPAPLLYNIELFMLLSSFSSWQGGLIDNCGCEAAVRLVPGKYSMYS